MQRFVVLLSAVLLCGCNVFLSLDSVEVEEGSTNTDDGGTDEPSESCSGSRDCNLECPEGGCTIECEGNSHCNATCSGGGCVMRCGGNAECEFSCAGGGCTFSCSDECDTRCQGGDCSGP